MPILPTLAATIRASRAMTGLVVYGCDSFYFERFKRNIARLAESALGRSPCRRHKVPAEQVLAQFLDTGVRATRGGVQSSFFGSSTGLLFYAKSSAHMPWTWVLMAACRKLSAKAGVHRTAQCEYASGLGESTRLKVIGEPNVSERREQEVSNPVLASTRFNSLTGSGGRTAPLAGSGGGSSGYSGGGGGGGGDDEARRYVAQVIARLNSARIGADQSCLQSLNNFASAGIARMQKREGTLNDFSNNGRSHIRNRGIFARKQTSRA